MSEEIERKTGMMKSHFECFGVPKSYPKYLNTDYEVRAVEDFVDSGKFLKRSCVKIVHPQDKFKGLKASDFALENVIAVGALDSLKEGYLSINNVSELSDSMEGSIDNLINAVDAAEAASQTNDGGNE